MMQNQLGRPSAEASVIIAATSREVYAYVTDLDRIGEWAEECYRCIRIRRSRPLEAGSRFIGLNRRRHFRWFSVNEVLTAEPDRVFTFENLKVARWEFTISSSHEATHLRLATWDIRNAVLRYLVGPILTGIWDRKARNMHNIEQSLSQLKQCIERPCD